MPLLSMYGCSVSFTSGVLTLSVAVIVSLCLVQTSLTAVTVTRSLPPGVTTTTAEVFAVPPAVTFTTNCCATVAVAGRMGALKNMVELTVGMSANGCCALYASPTGSVQSNSRGAAPDSVAVMLTVAVPAGHVW